MDGRVKLDGTEFEIPVKIHYSKDQDVVLGIRLFNLTLANKVMVQILNDQKIIKRLDDKIKEFEETLDRIDKPTVAASLGITKMMEELAILRTIRK